MAKNRKHKPRFAASLDRNSSATRSGRPYSAPPSSFSSRRDSVSDISAPDLAITRTHPSLPAANSLASLLDTSVPSLACKTMSIGKSPLTVLLGNAQNSWCDVSTTVSNDVLIGGNVVSNGLAPPHVSENPTSPPCLQDVRHNAATTSLAAINTPIPSSLNTSAPGLASPVAPSRTQCNQAYIPSARNASADMNNSQNKDAHCKKSWSSLFKSTPRNAGEYTPRSFVPLEEDGAMVPPPEVINAGIEFWSDYLAGFFLNKNPPYWLVKEKCCLAWKLKGKIQVHLFNSMFFFKFSNSEDRLRVLSSDPIFINGQPFIITPWSPSVDSARDHVLSIPVWTFFSQIPSVLQSLLGLNWLASNVGELKCFDANTVAREKLVFAKALIEITPDKPLPSTIKVRVSDNYVAEVAVKYGWTPDICSSCQSFGHLLDACHRAPDSASVPLTDRAPLHRPSVKWVRKQSSSSSAGVVPPSVSVPAGDSNPEPLHDVPAPLVDTAPIEPPVEDPDVDSDSSGSSEEIIFWNTSEQAWIHSDTGMRYEPVSGLLYRYVGEDEDDLRRLFYRMENEKITICETGKRGERNKKLLADTTWDRKYLYGPDSEDFEPSLYFLFSEYLHVIGPDSSDDGTGSPSDEGDQ